MTVTPLTLTGYITTPLDVTDADGALRIRFTLIYSPTDDLIDDVTLPCVMYDALASRADAEECLVPGTVVHVSGHLHLPDRPAEPMMFEVIEITEDGEGDSRGGGLTADPQMETPQSVGDINGYAVLVCDQPDGTQLLHVITPTGQSAAARTDREVALAVEWLTRQGN